MNNDPMFFIGEGRSGTTIIFEAFAKHPNIAFLSNYTDKFFYPQFGFVHRLFKKYGKKPQYANNTFKNKFLPKTSEAYDTWNKLVGNKFSRTFMRDIKATKNDSKRVKNYINQVVKYQNKKYFSTKLTGPPRITFLNSIFNNSKFVNIIRDPRAVVASLLNVDFRKKKGFKESFWKNTLTDYLYDKWVKYNKKSIALLALEWLAIYNQTKRKGTKIENKLHNLKYENFVSDPILSFKKLTSFLDIKFSDEIKNHLMKNNYKNMNYKYKERLNKKQIKIIEEICGDAMKEIGYRRNAP